MITKELKCGPFNDERTITLHLPANIKNVGIFHSGGVDSTILLHLVIKHFGHLINPTIFTVNKFVGDIPENSNRIVKLLKLEHIEHKIIDVDKKDIHSKFLPKAISSVFDTGQVEFVFTAGNAVPPEGANFSAFSPPKRLDNNPAPNKMCIPFLHIYKYHILDLYYREGLESILPFTHSCTEISDNVCGQCWFCNERKWAFEMLNRQVIPGM